MSYWTGTHWVAEAPATALAPRTRRTSHVLGATAEGAMLGILVVGLVSGTAMAGKGNGKGTGNTTAAAATCIVDASVVSATGLPTDQVINFFVTTASGKQGWVLGFTDDGTWSEPVPDRAGPTTYEFASKTRGPNGSHYDVFASCSAG